MFITGKDLSQTEVRGKSVTPGPLNISILVNVRTFYVEVPAVEASAIVDRI